jgi:dTDP-4-dehydrorhamnose 3,5-epimerase
VEARRDGQTVTTGGEPIIQVPAGVTFHDVVTQVDVRGELCEMFDLRWGLAEPAAFAYYFTVRPGMIKGWAMHEQTEDRYFLMFGTLQVVLYDERADSPTRGLVSTIVLSEYRRRMMNIPPGIWHANRNIGTKDAVAVNFKTVPFDHADPDKYRLPIDNDRIPFTFKTERGF